MNFEKTYEQYKQYDQGKKFEENPLFSLYKYGLDSLGSEERLALVDEEMYDEVVPIYGQKPENPKDDPMRKDTKMKRVITRIETRPKYTLKYSPQEVQRLFDLRNGNKCNMVIIDESNDHPGYGRIPFSSFRSSTFEECWDKASTPNFKLDRSYGDNLNNSSIG